MSNLNPLVTASWLNEHLNDNNLVVVDGTFHLPDTGRSAKEEFVQEHIPGARFFDLDVISDPENPRPRKVPPQDIFEREISNLGIDNNTTVVAYDTRGLYSAARVWWLFRFYGYDNVVILDGGFPAWQAEQLPVENGVKEHAKAEFKAPGKRKELLALWPQVLEASNQHDQILDARPTPRWQGKDADRYPGTRQGRIPNSLNLPWANVLDPETKKLLPKEELRQLYLDAGVDFNKPVIASCGSGLTACILALGMTLVGHTDWAVYDGSWDEWGRNLDLPVASDF
ncbi:MULTISPECIES: 3-mercaptopyruvate sulfurtransferase [Vibrio]|uniref:3-mercaptopyruvate sulfurtransferase n=2 Tax=Vibrio TaxID=662 RepID=A0A7X4LNQ6_9VIBR|nr:MULTISPECIES: 3-mercaptopyruvate sulfurtransferase [Vibrio]MBF9003555.1 3-mercaptopyruvate sulfurtransferase [Vibrio nitrifigilis]MZI95022.1 3-mercaptopyruvate sulfurtransferase [Vibrio eleionomae]